MYSIEMVINNSNYMKKIYIDLLNYIVIMDDKVSKVSKADIGKLLKIISSWKHNYSKNDKLDAEKFEIKINSNNGDVLINGNGEYPENYYLFKEWISDFCE